MATLYISEFVTIGGTGNFPVAGAFQPSITTQTVAIGATALASSAFNALTTFVRLHTDGICSVAFGANPTATTSSARLAANQTEYFGVVPGQKVSVITNT